MEDDVVGIVSIWIFFDLDFIVIFGFFCFNLILLCKRVIDVKFNEMKVDKKKKLKVLFF